MPSDPLTGFLYPSVVTVTLATPSVPIVTTPVLESTEATSGLSEANATVLTDAVSGRTVAEIVNGSEPSYATFVPAALI